MELMRSFFNVREEYPVEVLPVVEKNIFVKHYLIDTENMGRDWLGLLDEGAQGMIHVFYTEYSPGVSFMTIERMLAKRERIRLIKCYTGANALDFQLVTQLGYMIAQSPKDHYSIVSKDAGFDAVVKFWKDREITIERITESPAVTAEKMSNLERLCRDTVGGLATAGETKEIARIIKSVMEEDHLDYKTAVHTKLVKEFAQPRGGEIYQACKSVIAQVHCSPDLWRN